MGKIWLKSPDPNKQCCGCEGKTGPCDSCGACCFYSLDAPTKAVAEQRIDDWKNAPTNPSKGCYFVNWTLASSCDSVDGFCRPRSLPNNQLTCSNSPYGTFSLSYDKRDFDLGLSVSAAATCVASVRANFAAYIKVPSSTNLNFSYGFTTAFSPLSTSTVRSTNVSIDEFDFETQSYTRIFEANPSSPDSASTVLSFPKGKCLYVSFSMLREIVRANVVPAPINVSLVGSASLSFDKDVSVSPYRAYLVDKTYLQCS